jgi:outer membrane receptor protein involved in Fe transport
VPASFDAATVLNYEAGIKMDLLAKSLTLDAAVYYIDWDDIQVRQISSINTTYYINGSKAHSQGVEATASWHPVSGLTFAGNVSYNESKLDQALTGGAANKGDRLPDTPRWAGLLSGEYRFPVLSGWDASFGTSWRYVGERSGSLATTPYLLPAYRTWDVRAGLENERYSVHLFARNLGDERGYVSAFPFGAIQQVALIQPRTLGISVAATFE